MSIRTKAVASAGPLLVLALAGGCGTERPGVPPPACVPNETIRVERLSLELPSVDGTLRGVDLDGLASSGEATVWSCDDEADQGDPDGRAVDAELFRLVVALANGADLDPASALSGGPLEVSLERRGESVCAGGWVSLGDVRRPLEWNGSTYRAYELGSIPLELDLGEGRGELMLRRVAVRLTVDEGRVESLVLAGAVSSEELTTVLSVITDVDMGLLETLIEGLADLSPGSDGLCTEVSVSLVASF